MSFLSSTTMTLPSSVLKNVTKICSGEENEGTNKEGA